MRYQHYTIRIYIYIFFSYGYLISIFIDHFTVERTAGTRRVTFPYDCPSPRVDAAQRSGRTKTRATKTNTRLEHNSVGFRRNAERGPNEAFHLLPAAVIAISPTHTRRRRVTGLVAENR